MLWIPVSTEEASVAGGVPPQPCLGLPPPHGSVAAEDGRRTKDQLESWQWWCMSLLPGQWQLFTRLELGWAELLTAAGTQLDLLLHWLCPSGRPSLGKGYRATHI